MNGHYLLQRNLLLNIRTVEGADVAGGRSIEGVDIVLVVLVVVQGHYLAGYVWFERLPAHQHHDRTR